MARHGHRLISLKGGNVKESLATAFLCRHAPLLCALIVFTWTWTLLDHATPPCETFPANPITGEFPQLDRHLYSLLDPSHVTSEADLFPRRLLKGVEAIPSLTIFCAPKSFANESLLPQRRALLSWLNLKPTPKVVLLGDDPTFQEIANEFPEFVSVDSRLDYNFYGIPQFHSIVARAQAAETALSMIINGDIILLNDLMPAIYKVSSNFKDWILTAPRWDLGQEFPFSFEPDSMKKIRNQSEFEDSIRQFTREKGSLHTYGGVDFWLWNNSPVPLFSGHMPPFTFGRSKYDNWFTHEAVAAGLREVVDAGEALTNLHVAHAYAHVSTLANGSSSSVAAGTNFWSARKKSSWEMFGNIHLAESYGTYTNQKGTALHAPWRMAACREPAAGNICLLKRVRPSNCSCEYSPYISNTQSDPKLDSRGKWICGTLSVDKSKDYTIEAAATSNSTVGLPHTMEQLLPVQAMEKDGLQIITLVAVTFGYAEMLMNFICQLRLMGLDKNLVIAALDPDLYRFAFTQGLPVYYEEASDGLQKIDSKNCAYGSQCFRQFTKLKSRAVLRVLKAGYSVLWTDVDIVWYQDPLPHLMSFGPGTFPIQSNEPNASIPGTGIRRINSGFYFARSDAQTIDAFAAIVAHAAKTKLSEQPSFYDVLCGVKGDLLVKKKGVEECRWTNGLRTVFLDRTAYPNGAVHGFWNETDVTGACKAKGCTILHNNWISGKDAKKGRLVDNGYWHYDADRRMCMHGWYGQLVKNLNLNTADGLKKSTDGGSKGSM